MDTPGGRRFKGSWAGNQHLFKVEVRKPEGGKDVCFFTSLLTTNSAEKVEEQDTEIETEACPCRFVKLGGRKLAAATDTGSSHRAGMGCEEPGTWGRLEGTSSCSLQAVSLVPPGAVLAAGDESLPCLTSERSSLC